MFIEILTNNNKDRSAPMFNFIYKYQSRTFEQLGRMYPRPSPYIQSNLHKFGTGPSSTMLPVLNQLPVEHSKLSLNSNEYFRKTDHDVALCFCCLEPAKQIQFDFGNQAIKQPDTIASGQKSIFQEDSAHKSARKNQIEQSPEKNNQSQQSIMRYLSKGKGSKHAPVNIIELSNAHLTCIDCSKVICTECSRKCNKCQKIVCKFDYQQDNSLGFHNCS